MKDVELFNDHFQNYKVYGIPKAQLVIADIPYNVGADAYGSNPMWYKGGDNKNGESELAGKQFFDTDKDFRIAEYMHFCSKMLRPKPKDNSQGKDIGSTGKKSGGASCMIVFCAFEQQMYVIEQGKKYGFNKYIPLQFYKNYSPQVLKANMRVVGNTEYAILLYRNRLPKFNNDGRMVFNAIPYPRDTETTKVHPTQKSVPLLRYLIELFTDKGDVVIDPCAGSGSTLLAAAQCGRKAYGFEIKKDFFKEANEKVLKFVQKKFILIMPISEVYNCDCLEYMRSLPDNLFDLCIADPTYGIGIANNPFRQKHEKKVWDNHIPTTEVLSEMQRVSKHCIIWGGNYFPLPPNKHFIIWDKEQPFDFSSAMCEYAWSNIDKPAKIFRYRVTTEKNKIHPTQKPIALYSWILDNYAIGGGKIFDPFLGSGSSRIAAYKKGFDFYACELDKDYYEAQELRFRKECLGEIKLTNGKVAVQLNLFEL